MSDAKGHRPTRQERARFGLEEGPPMPGPDPRPTPPPPPKVRRTQGGTFIDAWCDQCDWRTEYITPVAAGLDAKAHAETNPTHTARWRRVEHRAYQAELS